VRLALKVVMQNDGYFMDVIPSHKEYNSRYRQTGSWVNFTDGDISDFLSGVVEQSRLWNVTLSRWVSGYLRFDRT
jgi:hypothetical protein